VGYVNAAWGDENYPLEHLSAKVWTRYDYFSNTTFEAGDAGQVRVRRLAGERKLRCRVPPKGDTRLVERIIAV
jgi:hypothetical protein